MFSDKWERGFQFSNTICDQLIHLLEALCMISTPSMEGPARWMASAMLTVMRELKIAWTMMQNLMLWSVCRFSLINSPLYRNNDCFKCCEVGHMVYCIDFLYLSFLFSFIYLFFPLPLMEFMFRKKNTRILNIVLMRNGF